MATETEKVSAERGSQYGDFGSMADTSQELRRMLVTHEMDSVKREAMQTICTKLARIATGNACHRDSWFDIAGYAMLVVKDLDTRPSPEAVV